MSDSPMPVWPKAPENPAQEDASSPPPVVDKAAEATAFKELLAFIKQHKDADTEVSHVSLADFTSTLDE